ncbi:MAG: riboflavin synthase [Eubacteriaceae bacterium]
MFTGLIEEIGSVKNIVTGVNSAQITILARNILEDAKIGDSICTNGVCLTITHLTKKEFTVDVMPETMRKTNLKKLIPGSMINLERALKVSDRLGGHIVSGHIDGLGIIKECTKEDNATWITIEPNQDILKYIIDKGSIAIDGTSLTVAYINNKIFKVSIIPLTKDKTILLKKKIGDEVNLECDVLGKYVEKLLAFRDRKTLDINFLKENGFY